MIGGGIILQSQYENDVLLIDKPVGKTSFDTISEIRKLLNIKKIGHSGTLDKFASGLLILCTGRATKLTRYFLESDKRYIGTIKLGVSTDTCDIDGKITKEKDVSWLTKEAVYDIQKEFKGEIMQVPPQYSALKIKGKRASDLAREGIEPELPERKVVIKKLKILAFDLDNFLLTIDVVCSKGTYIRALARDIGRFLNTEAHLQSLRRNESGDFKVENAVAIDEFKNYLNGSVLEKKFYYSPQEALSHFGTIKVDKKGAFKVLNGAPFKKNETIEIKSKKEVPFRILDEEKNLIAIVDIDIDNWRIIYLNVFN